jgi:hypothetical protein
VTWAQGWLVLPFAAIVAAAIFGQVTVNGTMTARYISQALRTRMYSIASSSGSSARLPRRRWWRGCTNARGA